MTADERQAVVRLCVEAYNEDFSSMYETLPNSPALDLDAPLSAEWRVVVVHLEN